MLDLVIRGGRVVTPEGAGAWDVGVEGERIVVVAAAGSLPADSARVIDATDKLVIPGGIDPHVHTGLADPHARRGRDAERGAGPGQRRGPLRRHDDARRFRRLGAGDEPRPGHRDESRRSGARATRTTRCTSCSRAPCRPR